jgi:hypothetical protein
MEPGGQALRFNSDARMWNSSRALSGQPLGTAKGEGKFEMEPSVTTDGEDKYRYIHQKMVKNKLSQEIPEVWYRLWVEDGDGVAQGYDPFYDTAYYLWATGQLVIKNRAKMVLNVQGLGEARIEVKWSMLKKWVLGKKEAKRAICEKLGYKPVDIRKVCFAQIRNGDGMALYNAHKKSKVKSSGDSDE